MTTTKISAGLYQLAYAGRTFQIENIATASDGDCPAGWIAYEMRGDRREYLNDYATKRAAIANTIAAIDGGF